LQEWGRKSQFGQGRDDAADGPQDRGETAEGVIEIDANPAAVRDLIGNIRFELLLGIDTAGLPELL
jgi:hypothetical protein